MRKNRYIGIYVGYLLLLFMGNICHTQAQEAEGATKVISAFRFDTDSTEVNVDLVYGKDGNPAYYAAHLETDVCSDDLCKPISITIHWDMVGRFLSYHTAEDEPLTKFDHILFTKADHEQLHRILSDTTSILRDYEVEDMIDTSTYIPSQQVDAVTRPTSLTFSAVTVKGALYTVYTLWHFINGPVHHHIRRHTASLVAGDDNVLRSMLTSENRDYVSYAFKISTKEQQKRLVDVIVGLLGSKDAYIPHFALARLEDDMIGPSTYQHRLLAYFQQADNALKNAMLDRLSAVPLDSKAMALLLSSVTGLGEKQIVKVFDLIQHNRDGIDGVVQKELERLSQHTDPVVARQAKNILSKTIN